MYKLSNIGYLLIYFFHFSSLVFYDIVFIFEVYYILLLTNTLTIMIMLLIKVLMKK